MYVRYVLRTHKTIGKTCKRIQLFFDTPHHHLSPSHLLVLLTVTVFSGDMQVLLLMWIDCVLCEFLCMSRMRTTRQYRTEWVLPSYYHRKKDTIRELLLFSYFVLYIYFWVAGLLFHSVQQWIYCVVHFYHY